MTHDDNFLEKWTLTSHLRATVTTNLKLLCKMDDNMLLPKYLTNSSTRKSQTSVLKILNVFDNINPFTFDQNNYENQLVNIFNGIVLVNEIADQLLKAKENGSQKLLNSPTKDFNLLIKQNFGIK